MYIVDFQKPIHVHMIGIGGISMSGLAEILLQRHFKVSGSDMHRSDLTDHLKANKKDHNTQRALLRLVGKRRQLLDYLKEKDIERYREIVKALGLRK